MDEDIVLIIAAAVTILGSIGGLLAGWWLWLRSRADRLRAGSGDELRALQDSVARLRSEVEATYGELTAGQQELHERIDFAERLLTQGKADRPSE